MGRERSGNLLARYSSTGGWLIRESTNQAGQYVLSVNWHGTPRHMRLMMDHRGCRISNLLFADVPCMLSQFKQTPFPIDSRTVSESTDPFRLQNLVSRVRPSRRPHLATLRPPCLGSRQAHTPPQRPASLSPRAVPGAAGGGLAPGAERPPLPDAVAGPPVKRQSLHRVLSSHPGRFYGMRCISYCYRYLYPATGSRAFF